MNKKNQINSCNVNAQRWYYANAMNKYKNSKNPIEKDKQAVILNYYLNGNLRYIKNL